MMTRKVNRTSWLRRHYRKVLYPAVPLLIAVAMALTMALPAGANINSISVGGQSGTVYADIGGTVSFTIDIDRNWQGTNYNHTLSVSGLPGGATVDHWSSSTVGNRGAIPQQHYISQ